MIGENVRRFPFQIRCKSTFKRQRPEEIEETILGKSESQVVKVSISVEYVCDCTASCLVSFQEKYVLFWLTSVGCGTAIAIFPSITYYFQGGQEFFLKVVGSGVFQNGSFSPPMRSAS